MTKGNPLWQKLWAFLRWPTLLYRCRTHRSRLTLLLASTWSFPIDSQRRMRSQPPCLMIPSFQSRPMIPQRPVLPSHPQSWRWLPRLPVWLKCQNHLLWLQRPQWPGKRWQRRQLLCWHSRSNLLTLWSPRMGCLLPASIPQKTYVLCRRRSNTSSNFLGFCSIYSVFPLLVFLRDSLQAKMVSWTNQSPSNSRNSRSGKDCSMWMWRVLPGLFTPGTRWLMCKTPSSVICHQ